MKVSELTGALLDYWVARGEGKTAKVIDTGNGEGPLCYVIGKGIADRWVIYGPSWHWEQAGPLLQKLLASDCCLMRAENGQPLVLGPFGRWDGSTPHEAICRAIVGLRFGETVPDEMPAC